MRSILEPFGSGIKPMKFKTRLIVRQSPPIDFGNKISTQQLEINSCCCCCSKGRARFQTQFEKQVFTANELCRVMCELDNSMCTQPCNNLVIELVRSVRLSTGHHNFTQSDVIKQKNFEGVPAGQTTNGLTRYLELSLGEITNDISNRHKEKALNADDYHLAQQIQPTCVGSHVQLNYHINVRADYSTCCATLPQNRNDLFIHPAPLHSYV